MEPIESAVWPIDILEVIDGVTNSTSRAKSSLTNNKNGCVVVQSMDLQYCRPRVIDRYTKLRELVSELAAYNPEYELYFRGQRQRFGKGCRLATPGHSLLPSIFRDRSQIYNKAVKLNASSQYLFEQYQEYVSASGGMKDARVLCTLAENPLARWAILQHYEICPTPLLDMTRTLQVACSFALQNDSDTASGTEGAVDKTKHRKGYVYVLGLPFQSEKVMAATNQSILNMSLLGITPSNALRPLVQDGYLACDRDWWRFLDLKKAVPERRKWVRNVNPSSYDFSCRILAVFKIADDIDTGGLGDANEKDNGNNPRRGRQSTFWKDTAFVTLEGTDLSPENDSFLNDFVRPYGLRKHYEGLTVR